ncbi:mechanosensitive ion channel domain-containing protein [Nitrososphaera sp.]|uniref:mechanosensitive ion channel domain-containing protein n=1 Tax=Nitrososphaera sp. TaxID=1971748 RepID=UPI003D6F6013
MLGSSDGHRLWSRPGLWPKGSHLFFHQGSTTIQPTLKKGQKISYKDHIGIIQEVGAFSVILKDEQGKAIVLPTKNMLEDEIIIESGPSPETQEKMVERSSSE